MMDRSLALLAIGLIFGGGIGFVVAAANGVTLDGHDHAGAGAHDGRDGHGGHDAQMMTGAGGHGGHGAHDMPLPLPADGTAPTLNIAVLKDPMSGWNLHLTTSNFRFAPEHASQPHVAGEGHAHVHVNGTKIARLYGDWMHIATLPDGDATIEVTLNANDHRPLAIGEEPLSASVTVATQ